MATKFRTRHEESVSVPGITCTFVHAILPGKNSVCQKPAKAHLCGGAPPPGSGPQGRGATCNPAALAALLSWLCCWSHKPWSESVLRVGGAEEKSQGVCV
eukprot:1156245-Pelagomonas_calceolata.AAC.4